MEPKKIVQEYLGRKIVMQLATSKDGRPRLCSVHFAFDENTNLYWVSSRTSRHSEELRENKKTAVAVLIDPDKKQCIHFEGESFELQGEETKKADEIYGKRFGISKERLEAALSVNKESPAYYIFKPSLITLIDTINFPDNPKQEIKL